MFWSRAICPVASSRVFVTLDLTLVWNVCIKLSSQTSFVTTLAPVWAFWSAWLFQLQHQHVLLSVSRRTTGFFASSDSQLNKFVFDELVFLLQLLYLGLGRHFSYIRWPLQKKFYFDLPLLNCHCTVCCFVVRAACAASTRSTACESSLIAANSWSTVGREKTLPQSL